MWSILIRRALSGEGELRTIAKRGVHAKSQRRKNKVGIRGVFFVSQKDVVRTPRSPRNPPQPHHQNTTFCTTNFAKTPYKRPIHHHRKNTHAKTDFPIAANSKRAGIAPGSSLYTIS
jgi:hypothetical protein